MKIKLKDLQLAMEYMEKEDVQAVDILIPNVDIATYLEFSDKESRTCQIKLFSAETNTTPELTKSMKLYTRFDKKESK